MGQLHLAIARHASSPLCSDTGFGCAERKKGKLGIIIAYIISPLDLLPEGLLGPVGLIDDIALAACAINQLLNEVDEEIVKRHWKGSGDLLAIIQNLIATANEMVGNELWSNLRGMVKGDNSHFYRHRAICSAPEFQNSGTAVKAKI